MLEKLNCYVARVSIFLVAVALVAGMAGCDGDGYTPPSEDLQIWDWYDLDAVRNNLAGNHILMNDLDSTAPGYEELASPTANGGKGWQPIGTFTGSFDGQGYEIRDLHDAGLFGRVFPRGVIKDVGVVNATVTGEWNVGSLAGENWGTVSNCYSSGNVTGDSRVGGLVGWNRGTVSNCYSSGNVTGDEGIGGLVGENWDIVSNCYSSGNVTGDENVGGLVGVNPAGTVSNSYSTGSVTGNSYVGGLAGGNYDGSVSNSYSTANVTGYSYVGGLLGANTGTMSDSYSTGSVTGVSWVGGLVGRNKAIVNNSFWDTETSGQATSDGGIGKTIAEMKNINTFSGARWNIISVADPGIRNPSYIWNIVDGQTYPFLSWEP
ncbi:MAG: GLUG motif-containing protein [Dehalococcoidia bacterium]